MSKLINTSEVRKAKALFEAGDTVDMISAKMHINEDTLKVHLNIPKKRRTRKDKGVKRKA